MIDSKHGHSVIPNRGNQVGKVKKRGGFTKICSLSPQLQVVVGEPVMARTEVYLYKFCMPFYWSFLSQNFTLGFPSILSLGGEEDVVLYSAT